MKPDVTPWPGVVLEGPVPGGHRNEVWAARSPDGRIVVRRSRRSRASLQWELELIEYLDRAGFLVPVPVRTNDGQLSRDGVVVQRWIDGREPATEAEWRLVATELERLHRVCANRAQRPTCVEVTRLDRSSRSVDADLSLLPEAVAAEVLAVFAEFTDVPVSVIHGDPSVSNLRITGDGRVALLDWDESRVDVVFHDLSNLGIQVLDDADHARARRLSDAWEAVNAWNLEPEYALRRLGNLRDG